MRPPRFAGRHEIIADILARIRRGPGRHEFLTVVVGPRGVGKTVLLGEVQRLGQQEDRWLTINWNAGRPLKDTIVEQRSELDRQMQGMLRRGLRRLEGSGLDLKAAPAGVGAEAHLNVSTHPASSAVSSYGMLEELGRAAAVRHRTVVVLVDEIQAASIDDLKELAAALQQLANVQRLPVGLVAVGLPSTHHLLRSAAVSPGFAERLHPLEIGNLDWQATLDAIEVPFLDAGREIDPDAVVVLARVSGGYPYAIQLAGFHCWEQAHGCPTATVDHAQRAVSIVQATLEARIFGGRWDSISRSDRLYLVAVARLRDRDGTVSTAAVADALGKPIEAMSGNRDRLINKHHVLKPAGWGRVEFAIPGLAE